MALRAFVWKRLFYGRELMTRYGKLLAYFSGTVATALLGAASVVPSSPAFAACVGPGAPDNAQTKCVTAIHVTGNPLTSFDISFVNPHRAEYYLADRSNAGITIIDTARPAMNADAVYFV